MQTASSKKMSLFTHAIDESYHCSSLIDDSDFFAYEAMKFKEIDKFFNKYTDDEEEANDLIATKMNSAFNLRDVQHKSDLEAKERKISDFFVSSWTRNLKNLKDKAIYTMPFHSANIGFSTKRLVFDGIPPLSL